MANCTLWIQIWHQWEQLGTVEESQRICGVTVDAVNLACRSEEEVGGPVVAWGWRQNGHGHRGRGTQILWDGSTGIYWYSLFQKKKNSEKEWIHNKSFKICSQLKETLIYWRQARYPCSETWFRYTNSITYCTSMTKSIYPGTLNVQRSWARKGT